MSTPPALGQLIERYLVSCEARGLSRNSITLYRYHLRLFMADANGADDWSTVSAIERHLARRRRDGISDSTALSAYTAIKVFVNWCVRQQDIDIDTNPMQFIQAPKIKRKIPRAIRIEDYRTLLDSIPKVDWFDYRDRLIVTTLFLSGIRIGSLVGLQIGDYDYATREIVIRTVKGGGEYTVPMLRPVAEAHVEYILNRPAIDADAIFVAARGRGSTPYGPMRTGGVRSRLRFLCERAGIEYLNPHAFRHGLARYLLEERNANLKLIKDILNHSKIETTAHYYAIFSDNGAANQYRELMEDI